MPDNRRQPAAPLDEGEDDAPAATIIAIPKNAPAPKAEPRTRAERIGDILRRARVARNEDLYHIAEYLCIKPAFLIALENSRYDEFPADAYVIGFLRTYASFLGVDSRDAVDRYRVEMAGSRKKPVLAMPIPLAEGRAPSGIIVAGAAVAILAIYALWYSLSSTNRTEVGAPPPVLPLAGSPATDAAPVPQAVSDQPPASPASPVAAIPVATVPVATVPTAAAPSPSAGPAAPAGSTSAIPPAAPGIMLTAAAPAPGKSTMAPGSGNAGGEAPAADATQAAEPGVKAATGDKSASAGKNLDEPATSAPASAAAPQPASAPGKEIFGDPDQVSHVILRATQTVWVNITDAGGKVVFDHVLKAGDIYKVPDQPGMHLNTGNGGGLAVTVDGAPAPKLVTGAPHVVRDISLDPARLQAGDNAKGE